MVKKQYKNIILLGSSHIAAQSVHEVQLLFDECKPQILALELDSQRLEGLLQRDHGSRGPEEPRIDQNKTIARFRIRDIGFKAYVLARIASFAEEKLGSVVGVKPGTEMRSAYERAKKEQVRVALIDRPITITLQRLSKGISWTEKWHFFVDVGKSFFAYLFGKPAELPFDLRTVPQEQLILQMIDTVRLRYPTVYRVLVAERNVYMAKQLRALREHFPEEPILAVVGAGHVAEIISLLETYDA